MIKSLTTQQLKGLAAGVMSLLLMAVFALPAQAQMDDGELPKIDFGANFSQSGQFVTFEDTDDGRHGFHQTRAGINASVQFSERVDALIMFQTEPSDFGANSFSPKMDYGIINVAINDALTFRTGTVVTGLVNFRGLSDGPAVQGNNLVNNSPVDMITAGHGLKLIGSFDGVGFDLTVNRSFAEDFAPTDYTGVNVIGNARYTSAEIFNVGAGLAFATGEGVPSNGDTKGDNGIIFANGDRDAVNIPGANGVNATQANMPNEFIGQVDGKVMAGPAEVDLWAGFASESEYGPYSGPASSEDYSAIFGGLEAMFPVNDAFYVAGRFSGATDQSDAAGDASSLFRIQGGVGYNISDNARFKVEGFHQNEGDETSLTNINENWSGVMLELSGNF